MEGLRTKVTGEQKSEEGKTFWVPADPKQKDSTVVVFGFFSLWVRIGENGHRSLPRTKKYKITAYRWLQSKAVFQKQGANLFYLQLKIAS